jgi:thioester reductase-like protein
LPSLANRALGALKKMPLNNEMAFYESIKIFREKYLFFKSIRIKIEMKKNIMITGGTGSLGWHLVKHFLQDDNIKVTLLARSYGSIKARNRIEILFRDNYDIEKYNILKDRINIIDGNIIKPNFGLTKKQIDKLSREVTVIFHCAAITDFNLDYNKAKEVNLDGTKNILDFALLCMKNKSFESVNHISTVAVSGKYRGIFYEDYLDIGQDFNNTYEKTKFEAEKLIQRYRSKGVNVNIFRPSIIVGDSKTGYTINFKVVYQPIHIFSLGIYKQIPAKGNIKYNIIPIDYLSEAIHIIFTNNFCPNQTFHMTNIHEVSGDFIFKTASDFFNYTDPERIPIENYDMDKLKGFRRLLLSPYIPYLNQNGISYDNAKAMNILKRSCFKWPKIDKKFLYTIFKFCLDRNFITPQNRIKL